eukprot:1760120-Prymnesium_polylepis.1
MQATDHTKVTPAAGGARALTGKCAAARPAAAGRWPAPRLTRRGTWRESPVRFAGLVLVSRARRTSADGIAASDTVAAAAVQREPRPPQHTKSKRRTAAERPIRHRGGRLAARAARHGRGARSPVDRQGLRGHA